MEVNLPQGETFIKYATIVGFSSPFVYKGPKTKEEILDIYKNAVDFAISQLGAGQQKNPNSFLAHLSDQNFSDQ